MEIVVMLSCCACGTPVPYSRQEAVMGGIRVFVGQCNKCSIERIQDLKDSERDLIRQVDTLRITNDNLGLSLNIFREANEKLKKESQILHSLRDMVAQAVIDQGKERIVQVPSGSLVVVDNDGL